MTATQTRKVSRTYTHAAGLTGDHELRCFVTKSGQHVVAHVLPAGEQDIPEVYRFDTAEAARAMWGKIQQALAARGYEW